MKITRILILFWIGMTAIAVAQEELTYIDLIKKLADLEGLAVLPVPGEKCAQWSSYDRASRYDAETNKYIDWDANDDHNGIIRSEGETTVIAEMEGPGCIRRIWLALAGEGHVKIYLDGETEPTIDLSFDGYFNCQNPPFIYPSLVHKTAKGLNCYVPIPYQKSCRITADDGWGEYYHFTYTSYPNGTIVPTFKRNLSSEEITALEAVDDFLNKNLGVDPAGKRKGEVTESNSISIPPGTSMTIADIKGKRAITALKINPSLEGNIDDINKALRELVLRITWDKEESPSVWVPLGDFFGTAPGINKYKSLPLGMTDEGFYSYWYMPFAKRALVELVNDGRSERSVEFSLTHAPLSRPVKQLGRFHAKWHRDALLPAEPEREVDWTILKTQGRGRYCGVMLQVWNPRGGWWGEGDEKFFVDGEKFPSTFGTGSEDFFGYAWCCPMLFQNAFHNQTFNGGDNCGHISVNRWQIADNVPFETAFEGAIEKYYPNETPTFYTSTIYWYLEPGGLDPYEPVALEKRSGYYFQPPDTPTGLGAEYDENTGRVTLNWKANTGGFADIDHYLVNRIIQNDTTGNIKLNPGFEEPDDNATFPPHWGYYPYEANVNPQLTDKNPLQGGSCVSMEHSDGDWGMIYSRIYPPEGSRICDVLIRGFVKTENVAGGKGALVALNYRDLPGSGLYGTYDYTRFEDYGSIGANGFAYAVCLFGQAGDKVTGKAWYDDVTVTIFSRVGQTTESTFVDTDITPGTTYYYSVRAVDMNDLTSEPAFIKVDVTTH